MSLADRLQKITKPEISFNQQDQQFMAQAQQQAELAYAIGEVPVGAVIVYQDKIISRAHNLVQTTQNPCAHAEILAITQAGQELNKQQLSNSSIYVTLEPCAMCAGALLNARISKIVFAAHEPKTGALGSVFNLFKDHPMNHFPQILSGLQQQASQDLLEKFFTELRHHKKGSK